MKISSEVRTLKSTISFVVNRLPICRSLTSSPYMQPECIAYEGFYLQKTVDYPFLGLYLANNQDYIWICAILLLILSQNMRRYLSCNVAIYYKTIPICIYTKEKIGQNSDGMKQEFHFLLKSQAVSRVCFTVVWVILASTTS